MKAEIISVGTELLLGQIVNTDAPFIAKQLSYLGIDTYYQTVVGDNAPRLKGCIAQAMQRSDIVFLTGGLGPTADDLTKETAAEYFGLPLERDEASYAHLMQYFQHTGKEMTPNNLKQVDFPAGARILENDKGTAPGCVIERDGKCCIILPGPPFELEDMFLKRVLPYLKEKSDQQIHSRVLRLFGIGESSCEYQLKDLMQNANPSVAPYAGYGEVTLRLTVKCSREENADALLDPVEAEIRRRVGQYIYAVGEDGLETVTVEKLFKLGKTIAVAESLTGGAISARLVDYPGMSAHLLEGVVAYSNEAKRTRLDVKEGTLAEYGAVSAQTAIEMARGVRIRSGADIGLSTTGIAGPQGGTEQKPVGLVYIGYSDEQGERAYELNLRGDRERVRRMSMLHAFNILRKHLEA